MNDEHPIYPRTFVQTNGPNAHKHHIQTEKGDFVSVRLADGKATVETNCSLDEAADLFFKHIQQQSKLAVQEYEDLNAARLARDEAGYIGTVAQCVTALNDENERLRLILRTIAYEAKQEPNTDRQARILNLAKKERG